MSEAELVDAIIELCMYLRLRVCHFRPALTAKGYRTAIQGHSGYPDLTIAGPGGVLFREVKSDKGKLTKDQLVWLALLGADVYRPCDWMSGRVERELKAISRSV